MGNIRLYTDVRLTKGYLRSSLLDLTRLKVYFIDQKTADIFSTSMSVNKKALDEYFFDTLMDNELIYFPYKYDSVCFTPLNTCWDFSFEISNFLVEVTSKNIFNLLSLGCVPFVSYYNFLIRNNWSKNDINKLFEFISLQPCDTIELSVLHKMNETTLVSLKENLNGLKKIVKIQNISNQSFSDVFKKAHRYDVNTDYLNLKISKNIDHYLESQEHHTYFNRKLYIGPNGEIKNAPECPETFGNIQDLENPEQLKEIVQTPEFQKYWYVHKEIMDVCKECEFRHMCVDNRLPYQRTENEWYHKQECNYNPYIAKWKDEEGYRTLAECGVTSDENGFYIDHEKIAKINEELWGEED